MKTIKNAFVSFKFYLRLNIRLIFTFVCFLFLLLCSNILIFNNNSRLETLQDRFSEIPGSKISTFLKYVNVSFDKINNLYYLLDCFLVIGLTILILYLTYKNLKNRNYELRSLILLGKTNIEILVQLLLELLIVFLISLFLLIVIMSVLYPILYNAANNLNDKLFEININKLLNIHYGYDFDELKFIDQALSNNTISMYNSINILSISPEIVKFNFSSIFNKILFLTMTIFALISIVVVLYLIKQRKKLFTSFVKEEDDKFKEFFNKFYNDKNYGFIFQENEPLIPYLSGLDNVCFVLKNKKTAENYAELFKTISKKSFINNEAVFLSPYEKILIQYYRLILENKNQIVVSDLTSDLSINEQRKLIDEITHLNKLYKVKDMIITSELKS
ncbi:hypothetical protein [Xylocopilactobacillus apis]|uniref:ABC transporter permease n=1 Tax=Xylocopilactobacillus apis TaxID=2932183 RepID=A0AAU9DNE5_9LACO|nr:hypothetical protein [Xylocopilactobacillus apis]BDR56453.1 hypothetical protein KIMC2_10150 [Xylocopilactobacillus apis]